LHIKERIIWLEESPEFIGNICNDRMEILGHLDGEKLHKFYVEMFLNLIL